MITKHSSLSAWSRALANKQDVPGVLTYIPNDGLHSTCFGVPDTGREASKFAAVFDICLTTCQHTPAVNSGNSVRDRLTRPWVEETAAVCLPC